MLLQEEQYIIRWLTQYGALTQTQVVRLLKDKPPETATKIIRNLKRQLMISELSGGYYLGVDPLCQPDQRIILAVWVLLQFIGRVEPMAHYHPGLQPPTQYHPVKVAASADVLSKPTSNPKPIPQ